MRAGVGEGRPEIKTRGREWGRLQRQEMKRGEIRRGVVEERQGGGNECRGERERREE